MFLEKYKNHRRLGKGAFGSVYLVEDAKGTLYALKIMSTKKMQQQPHLKNYLLGQIQCLKQMNSVNIIKLFNVEQDDHHIHLLLQYCDGGDLASYQAKLPDKVFTVDLATLVLTEVIVGLGDLHQQGYLHRDIKLQNILIKNQNGTMIYKLADFGFSKKIEDIAGTTLGTQNFMSPEVYSDSQSYGFEVDMWAFGVLFFFMLNLQYPFQMNPRLPTDFKRVALGKLAVGFSYLKAVKRTKKKLLHNCTDDMQDLFNRIFELDPNKRITFSQIRQHPVFHKHFLNIPQLSKNIYNNPIKPDTQLKLTKLQTIKQSEDYLELSLRTTRQSDSKYKQQIQLLSKRKIEIDFLRHNVFEFLEVGPVLKIYQKLMLTFHLLKYYIVLLRSFKNSLNKNDLFLAYPGLKWEEYFSTRQYTILLKEINNDLSEHQKKFVNLCDHCEVFVQQISEVNSSFPQNFQKNIKETAFEGVFKQSYRKSTVHVFGVLLPVLRTKSSRKGNKINYLLAQLLVCHAFNNLFSSPDNLSIIFKQYFEEKQKNTDQLDYPELREWMLRGKDTVLNHITKRIIKIFFTS